MDVVVFDRGSLRLAVRADEVDHFEESEDGARSLTMISGARLRFERARLLHLSADALRPLPALFRALASTVAATNLLLLDDELLLVISPDRRHPLPDELA